MVTSTSKPKSDVSSSLQQSQEAGLSGSQKLTSTSTAAIGKPGMKSSQSTRMAVSNENTHQNDRNSTGSEETEYTSATEVKDKSGIVKPVVGNTL